MNRWLALALPLSLVACAESTDLALDETQTNGLVTAPALDQPLVEVEALGVVASVELADQVILLEEIPRLVEVSSEDRDVQFGAVGMMVRQSDGMIRIDEIMDGMPAGEAGLEEGMQVLEVDGIETDVMTLEDFVSLVRGEEGSDVTLTVADADGSSEYVITLTRETLEMTENRCDRVRRTQHQSEFGGVGIQLGGGCTGAEIRGVQEGMPAEAAGLLAGDVIVAVDGMAVAGSHLMDVVGAVRGAPGSMVQLEVRGADGELRGAQVERVSMVVPAGGGCGE